MAQETFDGLTAAFCGAVLNALPRGIISREDMKGFVDHPGRLKSLLAAAFAKTAIAVGVAKMINPRDTLTTREGLWVSPDLEKLIGLDPCEEDDRA